MDIIFDANEKFNYANGNLAIFLSPKVDTNGKMTKCQWKIRPCQWIFRLMPMEIRPTNPENRENCKSRKKDCQAVLGHLPQAHKASGGDCLCQPIVLMGGGIELILSAYPEGHDLMRVGARNKPTRSFPR
jgi:hypothetical protein